MKQKRITKKLSLGKCTVSALNADTLSAARGGVVSRVDTCQRICPEGHLAVGPTIFNECPTQTPLCTDYLVTICC